MRSLLDAMSKPWPWNSRYLTGSAAALLAVYWWGLSVAFLIFLAVDAVWITVAGLRYRAQRKARQT